MWWLLEITIGNKRKGEMKGENKKGKGKKKKGRKQKKKKEGRERNLKETKLHIKTWNMSKTNHDLLGIYPKLVLTINLISIIWYIYHENIFFLFFLVCFDSIFFKLRFWKVNILFKLHLGPKTLIKDLFIRNKT